MSNLDGCIWYDDLSGSTPWRSGSSTKTISAPVGKVIDTWHWINEPSTTSTYNWTGWYLSLMNVYLKRFGWNISDEQRYYDCLICLAPLVADMRLSKWAPTIQCDFKTDGSLGISRVILQKVKTKFRVERVNLWRKILNWTTWTKTGTCQIHITPIAPHILTHAHKLKPDLLETEPRPLDTHIYWYRCQLLLFVLVTFQIRTQNIIFGGCYMPNYVMYIQTPIIQGVTKLFFEWLVQTSTDFGLSCS